MPTTTPSPPPAEPRPPRTQPSPVGGWGSHRCYTAAAFARRLLPLPHYKIASVTGGVKQVAAGGSHTVLLMEDGTVMTFGYGNYGQLGHGDTASQNAPKTVGL